MSEPQPGAAPRSRRLPLARAPSDVTRFRGLLSASVAGVVTLVLGLLLWSAPGTLSSPGALAAGHTRAQLACSDCHVARSSEPSCSGCHAGQSSRRAGHQELLGQGRLVCSDCHRGHARAASLVFSPRAQPELWVGGISTKLTRAGSHYLPSEVTSVPLVERAGCLGCHALAAPSDPASSCWGGPGDRFQRCFDEHRAVTERQSERDAAWSASLELVRAGLPEAESPVAHWGILGAALGVGLLVWGVQGWLGSRRAPPSEAAPQAATRVRLPQINTNTCLGCHACVDVCPFDVLEVRRFVAVVARPDACCGLVLCEQRCPNGSLVVREGEPIDERPRLGENLESLEVPGLYLAGDLSGLGLVRNAIRQGAHVARSAARAAKLRVRSTDYDLLVVGAGPAGLSATLEAARLGLRVVALEQGSVAESIRSFPRHKLILDDGDNEQAAGSLWLEQCTKEELVTKWTQIVRRERLPILEGHRMTRVERVADRDAPGFLVHAELESGQSLQFCGRELLLALGKRGTPRKLACAVPPSFESNLHYALYDARPFAGRRLLVVGLGDTAIEAALALAEQPGASVTLCARGSGFRRGKAKNVQALERLVSLGRVELLFETEISGFLDGAVLLQSAAGALPRQFDSVFVLIGAELPRKFLEELGVRFGYELADSLGQTR